MAKPKRIQRKRTKGWKMPPNTVYVGRPSVFANPFKVGSDAVCWASVGVGGKGNVRKDLHNGACFLYRCWIAGVHDRLPVIITCMMPNELPKPPTNEEIVSKLRGKNLACFCKVGEPCHADVLLEIANRSE